MCKVITGIIAVPSNEFYTIADSWDKYPCWQVELGRHAIFHALHAIIRFLLSNKPNMNSGVI